MTLGDIAGAGLVTAGGVTTHMAVADLHEIYIDILVLEEYIEYMNTCSYV